MALWKEATAAQKDVPEITLDPTAKSDLEFAADLGSVARRSAPREGKETVIGGEITIVGRIDGAGNVRLAGRFEGDVNIDGDLTIETGAKLTGSVRAHAVMLGGEIEGNIDGALRVELMPTGVLNGDLKAGTLVVAAGSKMRGRVEFGWGEETSAKAQLTLGSRHAS